MLTSQEQKTKISAEKAPDEKKSALKEKAKKNKQKKSGPLFSLINYLRTSSSTNTEVSSEKKKFPILAILTSIAATAMFMVIVASFMQMSQMQAEMKALQSEIRSLNSEQRELSMELEGRYSSKIESIASDLGLSGKYHTTYYIDSSEEISENVESIEEEKKSSESSLLNAIGNSLKKFLEFMD